ncbi:IS4 family transposase [Leadbetterella sp. DM7]|uniref:IS4 family transposase n=1 Tax=Leadbetterella sp. DM7 TaxID=3235085 RepID=UPI00349EA8D3
MHTLYDANSRIPAFMHITAATLHDVNAMDQLRYESDAFYIFDRAYLDYTGLYRLHNTGAYFVIRAKSNYKFRRMYSWKSDKENGVLCDQIGKLTGYYTSRDYPGKIRKVKFHDDESGRSFIFLTNNMEIAAIDIARLYKHRWATELFFKWVKQHLKIKSFWGTTENAVRIQIYAAITAYCLVSIITEDLKTGLQPYEILQVLGISLLDKTPVNELLKKSNYQNVKEQIVNQLSLRLF